MQSKRISGIYLFMLLAPLFWGGAFGTTKHVVTELPPLTASSVRFLLAGMILSGWVFVRKEWDWQAIRHNWPGLAALGFTGIFSYNFFFAKGLQYTSAINGALVVVINPVITAILAALFLGERFHWRLGLGVMLSLAGVLTVITQGHFSVLGELQFNYGEMLMFGAVLSWTAYTTLGKIVMRKVGASLATTVSTLIGAGFLTMGSLAERAWPKVAGLSGQVVAELIYLAIFATVIAFIIYNMGIQRIGAGKASAYINLMPVNAVLIAWALYGERVTPVHLAGMVLVVSGVLLTTLAPGPVAPAKPSGALAEGGAD